MSVTVARGSGQPSPRVSVRFPHAQDVPFLTLDPTRLAAKVSRVAQLSPTGTPERDPPVSRGASARGRKVEKPMLSWLFPFPEDISRWGGAVDDLFWLAVYLTGVAFLLVLAILGWCMVRYRARPGHRAVHTHGDGRPHLILTGAVAATVFCGLDLQLETRSARYFEHLLGNFPRGAEVVRIEVQAEQFAWNFRYAGLDDRFGTDDDLVDTVLRVPTGRPVVVALTSKDVIHSFFLPNVRIKQDAVPGLVTTVWFEVRKAGDYEVACAELCGNGHTRMRSFLKVLTPEAFETWRRQAIAEKAEEGPEDQNWGWEWKVLPFSGTKVEARR